MVRDMEWQNSIPYFHDVLFLAQILQSINVTVGPQTLASPRSRTVWIMWSVMYLPSGSYRPQLTLLAA